MPPGESGTTYESLDERCAACVIKGGEEAPCVGPHDLEAELRETGHPCPRREAWNVDDMLTAQLAVLGARLETGHLFRAVFDTASEGWPKAARMTILRRIARAYSDDIVARVLWPPRQPDKAEMPPGF